MWHGCRRLLTDVARRASTSKNSLVAAVAMRLDPPGTEVVGEDQLASGSASLDSLLYVCANCSQALFRGADGVSVQSKRGGGLLHVRGWPTFSDHLPGAVEFKTVLTSSFSVLQDNVPRASARAPSTLTATGKPVKRSLVLTSASTTNLATSIASSGMWHENRVAMRPGVKFVSRRKGKREVTEALVAYRPSAAQRKLREERRKMVLSHTQGHCSRCNEGICMVTAKKGEGILLVASASRLRAREVQ